MTFTEILIIAIGISIDCFSVSLIYGFILKKKNSAFPISIPVLFGVFQGLMPVIGFYAGNLLPQKIEEYGKIISFLILLFIGAHMIYEYYTTKDKDNCLKIDPKKMSTQIFMALTTSVDALATGFPFSLFNVNIYHTSAVIMITTFIISFAGLIIGKKSANEIDFPAEIIGGAALIIIGFSILF